ncbi:MAG: NAD(P)-binding protein, partial [Verrucomicrobiota bacterium]
MRSESCQTRETTVIIVGAGFAGIAMAVELQRIGCDDFVILEKGQGPGGVWRENTYPGAACDIPSFLYSFSFDQRSSWSRKFPSQGEILDYLVSCSEKFGLDEKM